MTKGAWDKNSDLRFKLGSSGINISEYFIQITFFSLFDVLSMEKYLINRHSKLENFLNICCSHSISHIESGCSDVVDKNSKYKMFAVVSVCPCHEVSPTEGVLRRENGDGWWWDVGQ